MIYSKVINIFYIFFVQVVFINSIAIKSQSLSGYYRVYLTDKNYNLYNINNPEEFLSQRTIQKRAKFNIPIDEKDLPISKYYIDSLKNLGLEIISKSKWMNSLVVGPVDENILDKLKAISFIKEFKKVAPLNIQQKIQFSDYKEAEYGYFYNQIKIHNGDKLHEAGYTGKNIYIAVIDAGYKNADKISTLQHLWDENKIIATKDFSIPTSNNIFEEDSHGTMVLSIIAGKENTKYIGTAPDAYYILLRSENVNYEYTIEEDFWTAAAEFADSIGTDIISTSLGYNIFDDPSQNYKPSEMDGKTSYITKAATIAASKGILVVVSAGNTGSTWWNIITAPADADSILSVGAIDSTGKITYFSARGPSADGRIKPDVCAIGYMTYLQTPDNQIRKGNGTSFSAPIIAGLTACLWQAYPEINNIHLIDAIKKSSNKFYQPDNTYGYGIPDFFKAFMILKLENNNYEKNTVFLYPNPVESYFQIFLKWEYPSEINFKIYNISGQIIYSIPIEIYEEFNIISMTIPKNLNTGLYILVIESNKQRKTLKFIKK